MGYQRAFTLIELLVTVVILSVVTLLLATFYVNMAESMQHQTARAKALESLTIVASSISDNLANLANNSDVHNADPFQLRGIDGDGQFEQSTQQQHPNLSGTPNDLSDRLHFFPHYENSLVSGNRASQTVYLAYWINGEGSDKTKSGLKGRYGLLLRRATLKHDERTDDSLCGAGYPVVPIVDGNCAPVLDLNQSGTNHQGVEIIGVNIDYLSFRYYDSENDVWENSWNSESKGYYPSVVQFAVRAYDHRVDENPNSDDLMTPMWYESAVSLKGKLK